MSICFRCYKEIQGNYWKSFVRGMVFDSVCFDEFKQKNKHYAESEWHLIDIAEEEKESCECECKKCCGCE